MKYKFVVSGAAEGSFCTKDAGKMAFNLGQEIVRQGGIVITGATKGMPLEAARGAKSVGGVSVGISPAATLASHVKTYKLPWGDEFFDFIIHTGFEYSGRNLILTKAADAVIVVCGGFGTLNEFTIALEDNKPLGILTKTGGVADEAKHLIEKIKDPHEHGKGKLIFESDPQKLVSELIKKINEDQKELELISPTLGE